MKIIILIGLFCICVSFIAFTNSATKSDNTVNISSKEKFEEYFTKYNPDLGNKGMMKSSFKHEIKYNR